MKGELIILMVVKVKFFAPRKYSAAICVVCNTQPEVLLTTTWVVHALFHLYFHRHERPTLVLSTNASCSSGHSSHWPRQSLLHCRWLLASSSTHRVDGHPVLTANRKIPQDTFAGQVINRYFSVWQEHLQVFFLIQAIIYTFGRFTFRKYWLIYLYLSKPSEEFFNQRLDAPLSVLQESDSQSSLQIVNDTDSYKCFIRNEWLDYFMIAFFNPLNRICKMTSCTNHAVYILCTGQIPLQLMILFQTISRTLSDNRCAASSDIHTQWSAAPYLTLQWCEPTYSFYYLQVCHHELHPWVFHLSDLRVLPVDAFSWNHTLAINSVQPSSLVPSVWTDSGRLP